MPKKMGTNSKAEEARARKAEADSERKSREAKEKEDKYWMEMEGRKTRSSKKREEEAEKKAEAMAKKIEAKRLAEKEEKEMEQYGKKVDKKSLRVGTGSVPKVTAAELARQKEIEAQQLQAQAELAKRRELRATNEDEYERMVVVENVNRNDDLIEARSVEAALAQMAVADDLPVDRHPEKRAKASYKAFEEAELAKLKMEKPGLTLTQYKDLIWKLWKKSPDNPLNQVN